MKNAFLLPTARTDRALTIRKAVMPDIHELLDLINGYAGKGIMLPRTEFEMSENIRDFTVAFSDSQLVGCGALHFYTPTTAEVRSLAVAEEYKHSGAGRAIVKALEQEALDSGLEFIFAFTYVQEFFRKLGFAVVERGELPLKAWRDCLRCPKFQCCDEIAMLKVLREGARPAIGSAEPLPELIQLPTLHR
jgi:amino-acid N-acetyltransferase